MDLLEVLAKLWSRWKVILKFMLVFAIAGVAIAFLLPRKYTARCTLGLEAEDRTTRISVEGMSAFQGMNVADLRNGKIVSPAMYPDILYSVPFQKELMYFPLFTNEGGEPVTFYSYLTNGGTTDYSPDAGNSVGVEQLTAQEVQCLRYLKNAISIKVDPKDGNLKIEVDMPEARMAAQLAHKVQEMLQQYIAKFRIAKAQAALDFIEGRYQEIKAELEQKQKTLIEFREKQKSQTSIQSQTEEKILSNDYELFFSLYSDMVREREKARIQVKENMPVLTVIEPVVEPTAPSRPNRLLIVLASVLLGFLAGCGWILLSPLFRYFRDFKGTEPQS